VNLTARVQTVEVRADGTGLSSRAGTAVLPLAAERLGLTDALGWALAETRERRSSHDPGRVIRDVAVMLADGGDCVTDMAAYEGQERLFGAKASETTTHRVLKAVDEQLLDAVRAARAAARARVWDAGARPDSITLNIDATLVAAHSDKERAASTYKHGYGFHPICCSAFHALYAYALGRLALLVAKRHKRPRGYAWWTVVYRSPDQLGLINLNATIIAPRPNRPWRD